MYDCLTGRGLHRHDVNHAYNKNNCILIIKNAFLDNNL